MKYLKKMKKTCCPFEQTGLYYINYIKQHTCTLHNTLRRDFFLYENGPSIALILLISHMSGCQKWILKADYSLCDLVQG